MLERLQLLLSVMAMVAIVVCQSASAAGKAGSEYLVFGGIDLGFGDKAAFVRLNRGNPLACAVAAADPRKTDRAAEFLLYPKKDVVLALEHGKLKLEKGVVAYVVDIGDAVGIFDLHDSGTSSITYSERNSEHKLSPGEMVVVTSGSIESFDQLPDTIKKIAFRRLVRSACDGKHCVFIADFSIVGAMTQVETLRELRRSSNSDERRLAERIIKTAACLSIVTANHRSYQHMK